MSKNLFNLEFTTETKLKNIVIRDTKAQLIFDNDQITLSDYHDQDCCESVYADWGILDLYKEQLNGDYISFSIRGSQGEGMLLCFEKGNYYPPDKVFIPCYNEQNGYYSSELKLEIQHKGETKTIDISEYEESIET